MDINQKTLRGIDVYRLKSALVHTSLTGMFRCGRGERQHISCAPEFGSMGTAGVQSTMDLGRRAFIHSQEVALTIMPNTITNVVQPIVGVTSWTGARPWTTTA